MFHWKNGWCFIRTEDGGVQMEHRIYGSDGTYAVDVHEIIDEDSWGSIVAAVSARGETREAWHEALFLHNKESG